MELMATVEMRGKVLTGQGPKVAHAGLVSAMHEAVALLEREVKAITPIGVYGAEGGLLSTVVGEVEDKGTAMVKGIVGTPSRYGEVIEKGRTAGKSMPPAGTLLRWIELKLQVSETEAQRLEFVIRRSIGKKGFEGTEMFKKAFDKNWPAIVEIFKRNGHIISRSLAS